MTTTATTEPRFWVRINGSDAPTEGQFATYAEGEEAAKALSLTLKVDSFANSLGMALWGPSGKIAAFRQGETIGYLDATTRRWVRVPS